MTQPLTVTRTTDQRRHQDAHAPTCSWWADAPRDQWAAVLEQQWQRMKRTRFNGYGDVLTADSSYRRRDAKAGADEW